MLLQGAPGKRKVPLDDNFGRESKYYRVSYLFSITFFYSGHVFSNLIFFLGVQSNGRANSYMYLYQLYILAFYEIEPTVTYLELVPGGISMLLMPNCQVWYMPLCFSSV